MKSISLLFMAAVAVTPSFGFAAPDVGPAAMTLIATRCRGCHNEQVRSSGLALTSAEGLFKGGKRGPAVVPGKPEESVLFKLVSGGPPRMPLTGSPLSKVEIETIRQWISQGANWSEPETWWSLKPLVKPSGAATIDGFIQAKLKEKGLTPSKEADRRTLIRRLTYDLHGLPPTMEEVEAFVADRSPDAYEKLVDRLLASPRYGERWGRHWLDVVHYGESHGYDKDKPRRNAWPYRDYVIDAFNNDKPYKRFVEEQLAGDALYPDDPQATVALGFIAAGPWDFVGQAELREGTTDKKMTRMLDRDDMVAVTMSAFVSMTAHCARCHDHKFDPIKQEEYYNLQSVFAGVDRADRPFDNDPAVFRERNGLLATRRAVIVKLRPLEDEIAELKTPEIERSISRSKPGKKSVRLIRTSVPPEIKQKIAEAAVKRKELVKAATPPGPSGPGGRAASRSGRSRRQDQRAAQAANGLRGDELLRAHRHLPLRHRASSGSCAAARKRRSACDPCPHPGALCCVPGLKANFDVPLNAPESARRAALAHWITDPNNMLTWRSIVNRVWHYHFGAGIVDTPNDFGHMGSMPTHPGTAGLAGR